MFGLRSRKRLSLAETHTMTARVFALTFLAYVPCTRLQADTMPLRPQELADRADLVVTGHVQSHRYEDDEQRDGSVIRRVFLKVKVESVEKGDAKPDDVIEVGCWTVVRLPREGPLYDGGHFAIPGDGGRARFYVTSGQAIFPNGMTLLDKTPPLRFEPPARPGTSDGRWQWFLGGAVLLMLVAGTVAFLVLRKIRKEG